MSEEDEEFFDAVESHDIEIKTNTDKIEPVEERWDRMMTNLEQSLRDADSKKIDGNLSFKEDYLEALKCLPSKELCEDYCSFRRSTDDSFSFEEPAARERSIILGNLSATVKYLGRIEDAIAFASDSLLLQNNYLKVRVRRAELYEENNQPHESLEDWKQVLQHNPNHGEAKRSLLRLPPKIEIKNEEMKKEMMDGLKKLGNMCLRPFGLSTENFKFEDNGSGGYNMQFQQ
ncbi:unnamed protein product [Oikopleura dioica]|uniref:Uncharacterized protein n=1 Tax=Oikopleura dioica TaxID=34765 RepID=E4XF03_OIKDI|nr:unnamed protein product [Oikopleura dioica]